MNAVRRKRVRVALLSIVVFAVLVGVLALTVGVLRTSDIMLWGAGLTGALFIVYYHLTATWWKTEAGWHLMTWTAATDFILLYLAYLTATRDKVPNLTSGELWFRLATYGVFFFLIAWRLSLVARAQRRPSLGRPPSEVPPIPMGGDAK